MTDEEKILIFLDEIKRLVTKNDYSIAVLLQCGDNARLSASGKPTQLFKDACFALDALCETETCAICGEKHHAPTEH